MANNKISREEAETRLKEKHPSLKLLEYQRACAPVTAKCTICGTTIEKRDFHALMGSTGCHTCWKKQHDNELVNKIRERIEKRWNGDIEILDIGITHINHCNKFPASFRCRICGHEWTVENGYEIALRSGCPKCSIERSRETHRVSFEEAQQRLDDLTGGEIELLEYTAMVLPARIRCRVCGNEKFSNHAYNFFTKGEMYNGEVCPACYEHKKECRPVEEFLAKLENVTDKVVCLDYKGMNNPESEFKCLECGHVWKTKPNHVIYDQTGCPACKTCESFPEEALFYYVSRDLNGEPVFRNPKMHFGDEGTVFEGDVYVPGFKTLLEYDGNYWHERERVIENDKKRERLCEQYGITILHICEKPRKTELMRDFYITVPILVSDSTIGNRNEWKQELGQKIRSLEKQAGFPVHGEDKYNAFEDYKLIREYWEQHKIDYHKDFYF